MSESEADIGVMEAAERAHVVAQEIYRQVWQRRIIAHKDSNGKWRIDAKSLARWMELRGRIRELRGLRDEQVQQ